jgi:hypothetical protein
MRRVLNLLQATHMAYPEINETVVYVTAGAAIPAVISSMLQALLNENFETAYNTINAVRIIIVSHSSLLSSEW